MLRSYQSMLEQMNTAAIKILSKDPDGFFLMVVDLTASGAITEDGPFYMPGGTPFYFNWKTTGHTSVYIHSTAQGKLSDQLPGTYENTYIYEIMRRVLGWELIFPLVYK